MARDCARWLHHDSVQLILMFRFTDKEVEATCRMAATQLREANYQVQACWVASVMSGSATLRTVAHQAPLSMGFSRQGYWSGLPCPPPGDLPNPGIEPTSLKSTCIGRWVLCCWRHLRGKPNMDPGLRDSKAYFIHHHQWMVNNWLTDSLSLSHTHTHHRQSEREPF